MTPPVAIGGRAIARAVAELAEHDAWVCWRAIRRFGKPTKPPFTPAGSPASSTDPRTWSSFDKCFAAAFADGRFDGIGRVLVDDEGFVAIDLDDACASDGAVAPWANKIVRAIPTYWERSPSRTGLHGWCLGHWPTSGNRRGNIEVYASARFLTVTGAHIHGTPETIEPVDLAPLVPILNPQPPRAHEDRPLAESRLPEAMPSALVQSLARTHPQLRRILECQYPSPSERDLALVRFAKLAR
jgi:hypothetical protein